MFGFRKKDLLNPDLDKLKNRIEGQRMEMPKAKPVAVKEKEPVIEEQEQPIPATAKAKGNGNGKKSKEAIKETVIMSEAEGAKPSIPITPKEGAIDDLEKELEYQSKQRELEEEAKIPGNGWFLGEIRDKHLPMQTVLDRGEVLTFALGNMQENMLNAGRTDSLFKSFARDIMQMNISIKGLGREQSLMARQQDADRNATTSNMRDMMGKPGAL
jgi:hypothetical protein